MSGFLEKLRLYFENTPREKVEADWAATEAFDAVGPTVEEFLDFQKSLNDASNTENKNDTQFL